MKKLYLFFLACLLFLTGCVPKHTENKIVIGTQVPDHYDQILSDFCPDYQICQSKDTIYEELRRGNAAICFDVQAIPAMEKGVGTYWYPQTLATYVIAVDRSQTSARIIGWRSLLHLKEKIGISANSSVGQMLLLGSLSYGLNGKSADQQNALDYLGYIYQNDRLLLNNNKVPIILCLDYEAKELQEKGRDIEIIVPKEGTLSFTIGILSNVPLQFSPGLDDALLSSGLPLAGGNRPDDYPEPAQYSSATRLRDQDFTWFLGLTRNIVRDMQRKVMHTRLWTVADMHEHMMIALFIIIIILFWKWSTSQRIIHAETRKTINIIAWLLIAQIFLCILTWQIISPDWLNRLIWYARYIPELGLSLALLYLAEIVAQPVDSLSPLRSLRLPAIFYILALLLIMTNDLHQWVFRFDAGGNWVENYDYGIAFWIVIMIFLLFGLSGMIMLIRKRQRNVNWIWYMYPLLVLSVIVLYAISYFKKIPLARESDYTIVSSVLIILFFESLLHTGFIPINIKYHTLFSFAPIGLNLLDQQGNSVLSSNKAPAVSHSIWQRLKADINQPLLRDSNTLLHALSIHGGMVVWQEDLSQINHLRENIQATQMRLEAANTLLLEESEVKKKLLATAAKQKLFEQLDQDMEHRLSELATLMNDYTNSPEPDHQHKMAYITLCLCHIKRRCNLFFLARQNKKIPGEELSIYFDELAELAGYTGIRILIRCGIREEIDIRTAAICYAFCFESISQAIQKGNSPILGYLEGEENQLAFRLLPSGNPEDWIFSDDLKSAIAKIGGQIICKDLDDAVGIWCMIPWRGKEDGTVL